MLRQATYFQKFRLIEDILTIFNSQNWMQVKSNNLGEFLRFYFIFFNVEIFSKLKSSNFEYRENVKTLT